MDMESRSKWEIGDCGDIDVDETAMRVMSHNVPGTNAAKLAVALVRLSEAGEMLAATGNFDLVFVPERERVNRPGRPRATGTTMAVAHDEGGTGDLYSDRAAETGPFVGRHFNSCS